MHLAGANLRVMRRQVGSGFSVVQVQPNPFLLLVLMVNRLQIYGVGRVGVQCLIRDEFNLGL